MRKYATPLLFLLAILSTLALTTLALAQTAVETLEPSAIAEAFQSPETLYLLLVVPITQFLKVHLLADVLDALGPVRPAAVVALALLVGGVLGIFGEAVQLLNLGFPGAFWFGVTAGLVGAGLKAKKGGGTVAPASSTRTDASRARLRD